MKIEGSNPSRVATPSCSKSFRTVRNSLKANELAPARHPAACSVRAHGERRKPAHPHRGPSPGDALHARAHGRGLLDRRPTDPRLCPGSTPAVGRSSAPRAAEPDSRTPARASSITLPQGEHEDVLFQPEAVKYLSSVVLMELRAGAFRARDVRLIERLETTFAKADRLLVPSRRAWSLAGTVLRGLHVERGDARGGPARAMR